MNDTDMLYIALGFVLAMAGFGIYAMQVFSTFKRERKAIEDDFEMSKKYDPSLATGKLMLFIMMGSTGVVYTLLLTVLLMVGYVPGLENAASLMSKFIMIMGATVLVADMSRIPVVKAAMKDIVYEPILPEDIKKEKNLQKRAEMAHEFMEKEGLNMSTEYFGKHLVFMAFSDTMLIYVLLISMLVMVFSGLISDVPASELEDISPEFAERMFAAGVLYLVLTIPAIFSMKKSAEIPMSQENFGKKVRVALYGLMPSIIGLAIMPVMIVQFISE